MNIKQEEMNNLTDTIGFVKNNSHMYMNADLILRGLITKKQNWRNYNNTNVVLGLPITLEK